MPMSCRDICGRIFNELCMGCDENEKCHSSTFEQTDHSMMYECITQYFKTPGVMDMTGPWAQREEKE